MSLGLLLSGIIFIPAIVVILLQIGFYMLGLKNTINVKHVTTLPSISVIMPIKNEDVNVIQGALNNIAELDYPKEKVELVIISDDDQERFNYIMKSLNFPLGLEVKIVRREERKGFKSGALQYGLYLSSGELILSLDVDGRLKKNSLRRAVSIMEDRGCDAVVMDWRGYSTNNSTLSKGLIIGTTLASVSGIKGRDRIGFQVFPVGSGTLFKRSAIVDVGGWNPYIVQEDLEIGCRMFSGGKKICGSDIPIEVEVPSSFEAFYIQQTRWAMGCIETIARRLKDVVNSKISILNKIDAIIYLLQYLPVSLTFVGTSLLAMFTLLGYATSISLPLFLVWIAVLAIYGYLFLRVGKNIGFPIKDILFSMGRVSAFTASLSPFVFYWSLKGFSRKREFRITPKGGSSVNSKLNVKLIIVGLGFLYISTSVVAIIRGELLSGLWLFYYSSAYIYTGLVSLLESKFSKN
ncbi:glycosyl transferase family 2 [Sulfolobales archaeon HS-7]|nr:glycosyl transferase family 2 [Sulfolobales archaeon HS-7]